MEKTLKFLLLAVLLGMLATSCQNEEFIEGKDPIDHFLDANIEKVVPGGKSGLILPDAGDLAAIPQDPRNPLTPQKVALGQKLYHETGLATNPTRPEGMYTYSCSSCHHAQGGFQACKTQAIGEGGVGFGATGERRVANSGYPEEELDVQPIRTPSALNIAYQTNILWNGQFGATALNVGTEDRWEEDTPLESNRLGYEGTETQAIAGIKVHRMGLDSTLIYGMGYKALFDEAFPNFPEDQRYTRETAGLAIAAYERTLLSNEAPFQRWLRGDYEAMDPREKRGANLFFTKGQCYSCHNGPALNSMAFYALGMDDLDGSGVYGPSDDKTNLGRGGFTGRAEENYKFKVPQLYNLKSSPFYGHGGNFHSVREVVEYKNQARASNPNVPASQLAEGFIPLDLTADEVSSLAEFVERALFDPSLHRYLPSSTLSGYCFPNNDPRSRADLGCQ